MRWLILRSLLSSEGIEWPGGVGAGVRHLGLGRPGRAWSTSDGENSSIVF